MDHFLQGRVQGLAIRRLGHEFRVKDALNPAATLACNAYQVSERVQANGRQQEQRKNYCFESKSRLLLSVAYETGSSPPIRVETRFADWHPVQGQMLPGRIARFENGAQVLLLTISQRLYASLRRLSPK